VHAGGRNIRAALAGRAVLRPSNRRGTNFIESYWYELKT
jgi:hypothetical protein